MELIRIASLVDNYIWLLRVGRQSCVIVDPSESAPVLAQLQKENLVPLAILLTHHHSDHVDGVADIIKHYPTLPVYGSAETKNKGATQIVKDGDTVACGDRVFNVISVPGHTLGHIAYQSQPYLFCGDTLFSAGCGRIFEGSAEQMYHSIEKIAALSDDTLICCAHEYTLSNLKFAHHVWPQNSIINQYLHEVSVLRDKHIPTVPTTLAFERKINVFLNCNNPDLQNNLHNELKNINALGVFTLLRTKKDQF